MDHWLTENAGLAISGNVHGSHRWNGDGAVLNPRAYSKIRPANTSPCCVMGINGLSLFQYPILTQKLRIKPRPFDIVIGVLGIAGYGFSRTGHQARTARVDGILDASCEQRPLASPLSKLLIRGRPVQPGALAIEIQ